MDPGTGKTLTALMAFYLMKKRGIVDKMLVLAPLLPAYEVWPAEVVKHGFSFKVAVLHGPQKLKRLASGADIFVVNYDGLVWLQQVWKQLRGSHKWWLVCDESTKVKHTNTRRFKFLKPLLGDFRRRAILTGTPAPNGLEDLFGQVYVLDLGARLGHYITQYRREFFFAGGYGGYQWFLQPGAETRIHAKLSDVLYRVSDEVLNLKPIRYNTIQVSLSPQARKTYEEFEKEFIIQLGKVTLTAANAGVLSSKLRQIANGMVYDAEKKSHEVHDAKLEALTDLVEQLQGNPLLVAYEFNHDGLRIAKRLKAPVINGQTPPRERSRLLAEFDTGRLPVLVCQYGVIALGGNLQAACHTVALYGLAYDLETYVQLLRRVHRKGQKKGVIVHRIMARDTMDDLVLKVLTSKGRVQDKLLAYLKERYMK